MNDHTSTRRNGGQISRLHAILRWQAQINADPELERADVKVAMQLCQRTNEEEFDKSGELVTWQGVALQATESVQDDRTVQRATRVLQQRGYVAVEAGGGRGLSNRITLLMRDAAKTPAHTPPFSGPERVANSPGKGGKSVYKPRHSCATRTVRTNRTLAQTTEIGPSRASPARVSALGPHEPGLRKRLGNRWVWMDTAKLVSHSAEVVKLSVLTEGQAINIRDHCEADILAEFGVSRLEFEIVLAPKQSAKTV